MASTPNETLLEAKVSAVKLEAIGHVINNVISVVVVIGYVEQWDFKYRYSFC